MALWGLGLWGVAGAGAIATGIAVARVPAVPIVLVCALAFALLVSLALSQPKWLLIVTTGTLAAYIPEAVEAGRPFPVISKSLVALVLLGILARRLFQRQRLEIPPESGLFLALAIGMSLSTFVATDRVVAAAEVVDYASHALLVILLLVLIDRADWLRRAMWAVALGPALLAALAVLQQLTHSYANNFGGLATVEPYGTGFRSSGPLSPVFFGQLLVVGSVLALYLFMASRHRIAKLTGLGACLACLLGISFTLARASVLAVTILRRARGGALVALLFAVIAIAAVFLPSEFRSRFTALGDIASDEAALGIDSSIKGRLGENLAAIQMWVDHPYLGVGPDNYDVLYRRYSQGIGLDPQPEDRQPHNLYLEALAETGLVGAAPFFSILWIAASRPWRKRRNFTGDTELLVEGAFVAMLAFLITALTLHLAYSRNLWLTVGLALAAGRLRQQRPHASADARLAEEGGPDDGAVRGARGAPSRERG
jgi:O-antigen ligase